MGIGVETDQTVRDRFVELVLADRPDQGQEEVVREVLMAAGVQVESCRLEVIKNWRYEHPDDEPRYRHPTSRWLIQEKELPADHQVAGFWLDTLYYQLRQKGEEQGAQAARQFLDEVIAFSQPLPMIQLTNRGDLLREPWPAGNRLEPHPTDSSPLGSGTFGEYPGVHYRCWGKFKWVYSSPSYQALCCPECYLRVPVPATVSTYGELRQALREELQRSRR